ncbi:MAG: enoyl-CoA hydratase-related protein [Actinomycetota bacterium]|nr:enoyl-CoA hydratase-related protein [Actinomycetota bacterium]
MSDSPTGPPLSCTVRDGVATLVLDRPAAMNALNRELKVALRDTLHSVAADPDIRAVVLTGNGRAFCVGQDLREHERVLAEGVDAAWGTVDEHYSPITTALATMPKPVVAAVNGVAAGAGAAFAFACDLRVVADTASFNLAFAAVGLSCDSGSSWTLPRLVGPARAKELLMMPRTVRAEEALALGLASQVVPAADVLDVATNLAGRLAAGPTVAYGAIRRAVAFSAGHDLTDSLVHEAELMRLTGSTEDHRRAVESFNRKETPVFEGH